MSAWWLHGGGTPEETVADEPTTIRHPRQWLHDIATKLGAPVSWVEGRLLPSLAEVGYQIVPLPQGTTGSITIDSNGLADGDDPDSGALPNHDRCRTCWPTTKEETPDA